MAKKTSSRFTTQEGAMSKPSSGYASSAHVLTTREIAKYKRKQKSAKKK